MKKWIIWAVIFYVHALFLAFEGISRVVDYNYDEIIDSNNRYAYVGGDAYNYIINANIQTSFFTLSGAFLIMGTLMIVTGSIVKAINKGKEVPKVEKDLKAS